MFRDDTAVVPQDAKGLSGERGEPAYTIPLMNVAVFSLEVERVERT
jgi:hypothetical protein